MFVFGEYGNIALAKSQIISKYIKQGFFLRRKLMKKFSVIGTKIPLLDAANKVTGKAVFTSDVLLPNMLYGKILRSPYAHARILNINKSKAEKLLGVKAIITANDVRHSLLYGIDGRDEPLMSWDGHIRFVGQEIASVAAIDRDVAAEACDLIEVEYEELPAVFDVEEALRPDAPQIHPELKEVKNNIAFEVNIERGSIEQGFREADVIVEDRFEVAPVNQAYMEPDVCVAHYDASGQLNVWVSSTWPSNIRDELAYVLEMPISKIRVLQDNVGGAFGAKFTGLQLHHITALLAMKSGRPVKISLGRDEDFLTLRHRSGIRINWKLGAKKDGSICAQHTKFLLDQGAYLYMIKRMLTHMCCRNDGLYRIKNVKHEAKAVYTNKAAIGTYRSFGDVQMSFGREQMLDILAEKLGMSVIELRLKNANRKGDTTPHGWKLGSCGLVECIDKVSKEIKWTEKKAKMQEGYGIGIACTCHETDDRTTNGSYGSIAYIKLLEDGKVQILTGEADTGQGSHNAFAMTAAEELGIPVKHVEVLPYNSDLSPWAWGYLGSRVMSAGVNATYIACQEVKKQCLITAAEMLGKKQEGLEYKEGKVVVKDAPEKSVSLSDIGYYVIHSKRQSAMIIGRGIDERPTEYTLDAHHDTHYGHSVGATYFDTLAAEVEVNAKTGEVKVLHVVVADDCGKIIDRMMIEGQVDGAIVQGLGATLMEERKIDDKGQLVNYDFDRYKVPHATDVPTITKIFVESNEPSYCYGHKGGGESPGIGSIMPAVANAIYDAVGVRIKSTPITPKKVLEALAQKGSTYI
jgi:CO/xanthine dehydrogenase Mo-binding subunit